MTARLAAILVFLMACSATAQVTITVPRDATCRVGDYMPIVLTAPPARTLRLEAAGIVPLHIRADGRTVDATFRVLVLAPPGDEWTVDADGVKTVVRVAAPPPADEAAPTTTLGPTSAVAPAAYAPVAGWSPGVPARDRRTIVLAGVLASIACVATTLLRKAAWLACITMSVLCGFIAVATLRPRAVQKIDATIIVQQRGGADQVDLWSYRTATRAAVDVANITGDTMPVLVSPDHASRVGLTLHCLSDGTPRHFRTNLAPGRIIAYRSTGVSSAFGNIPVADRRTSPLLPLVKEYYAAPGTQIIGEYGPYDPTTDPPNWPAVVLSR